MSHLSLANNRFCYNRSDEPTLSALHCNIFKLIAVHLLRAKLNLFVFGCSRRRVWAEVWSPAGALSLSLVPVRKVTASIPVRSLYINVCHETNKMHWCNYGTLPNPSSIYPLSQCLASAGKKTEWKFTSYTWRSLYVTEKETLLPIAGSLNLHAAM